MGIAVVVAACEDTGSPPADAGATDARDSGVVADVSSIGETSTTPSLDGPGVEVPPDVPPGGVAGVVANATAASFRFPDGIRFRVSVEGRPDLVTTSVWRNDQHEFDLAGVPEGAQTLILEERDPQDKDSWDLFQSATRRLTVQVPAGGNVQARFELASHWEPHKVDAAGEIRSCDGIRQLQFHGPQQGALVFQQEAGAGGVADPHGAVMVTADGGRTWTVASRQMLAGSHSVGSGNWFGGHPLLFLPGGRTALSLPQFGPVARSTDGGATWAATAIPAPTWGPGSIEWTGVARSGSSLFVPLWTGGVQGSSVRTSLHRSDDGGASWQTILDRCDRGEVDQLCANPHHPNLPVEFSGVDVGCGPPGHCVVVGKTTVLTTTNGFATWKAFSVLPPGYGCAHWVTSGRIYWIPGTSTGWLVVNESACGNPRALRRITTDGGATWGDWEPSPVSAGGDLQFGDALTGFALEVRSVSITRDGGKTFKYTGAPPHDSASNAGLRLSVVGPDHAWVSAVPNGGCTSGTHVWIAAWRP